MTFMYLLACLQCFGGTMLFAKNLISLLNSAYTSRRFQPNTQLGKQLMGALKQQHTHETQLLKAQSASFDASSQRLTEQNITSRILIKRREMEASSSRDETSNSAKRSRKEVGVEVAEGKSSADFESSHFIGRSMLANLGWKEGSALGTGRGSCQGLIEVTKKSSNSGLGRKDEEGGVCAGGGGPRRGPRCVNWEKAQSRYNKIDNEVQQVWHNNVNK
jgi:hypothetical protein